MTGPPRTPHALRAAVAAALAALPGPASAAQSAPPRPLTFAEDVAPIVRARCAPCHVPGGAAPFALLDHADVAKRTRQIADVVGRRVMPPWPPVPDGGGPFVGERRLPDAERALLLAWIEQGAPSGDLALVPPPPPAPSEWTLGTPDIVLELDPACDVPAEGRDVYTNFVLPVPPAGKRRFVRAFELLPGNARVLHHAVVRVDSTGSARALDARDPAPGFAGMGMGEARVPDGHFLGWAPGQRADAGSADMAWALADGDDLVLQMHLRPTGKPETIRPRIGLHFTERAPEHRPLAIVLSSLEIDIPAGASDHVIEAEYALPISAAVLSLYPHAHYLGREITAWAELPGGGERPLLRIDPWDFDWQDSYRYVEPVALPAGAVLRMRWRYDNSSANPLNPSSPPRRVVYGESSADEMAELLLQLLPARAEDRAVLERDFALHQERQTLRHLQGLLERAPGDARLRYSIALAHERLGEWPQSLEHLGAVVAARPRDALARSALARVLVRSGDLARAEAELERARTDLTTDARARQVHVAAWIALGDAHRARGDSAAAERCFRRALELAPEDPALRERLPSRPR